MQRHNAPCMPSRICASLGFGCVSSSTFAVRICPFWQKPHCGTCSSIHACCTGWSVPFLASPSSVVISAPATVETGLMHDRTASPLIRTMHAPHCPRPQPKRGPDRSRSLRRTYSRGVEGSTSTVCALPFTRNVMAAVPHSLARVAVENQVIHHRQRERKALSFHGGSRDLCSGPKRTRSFAGRGKFMLRRREYALQADYGAVRRDEA